MLGFLRSVALGAGIIATSFLARPAAAVTCLAPDIVASVPFFQDKMTVVSKGISAVAYVHHDDPRITASFQTAIVPPPSSGTSRQMFAGDLQRMMSIQNQAAIARGGSVTTAVNPFDPVQWRVLSHDDPVFGADRLVGQYGIYVSSTCLLTATITAPEGDPSKGDAFKRRWNDLAGALDAVRDSAANFGEPIIFAQDDLSPKGRTAYVIGVGLPTLAATVLFFILGRFVTVGQPSLFSRIASGLIALCAETALAGTLIPEAHVWVPVEMRVLIGAVAMIGTFGALWRFRWATLGAICIAVGAGLTLAAYASFGWTPGIDVAYGLAVFLVVFAVTGALTWGSSRTALAEA